MTEVVDKTLIERLILEHSDRLELEINHKARADAWKFYYRVRVDHVIRPFAVCKVCFRVLHCDSRSGTASLLRHPCNPLSERSPVNRAVKLSAKLNLPPDGGVTNSELFNNDHIKRDPSPLLDSSNNVLRQSPVGGGTPTSNCPSPTSTGSPPSTHVPSIIIPSINSNGGRKRKVGGQTPSFPLDLRLLQLPQMMAAVAAHPLAALNIANATAFLTHPQNLHHLQQQQSHLEHLLREHHLQQERESKRNREEEGALNPQDRNGSYSGEAATSSSPNLGRPRVKKERADTSEETLIGSYDLSKQGNTHGGGHGRHGRDDADDHLPGGMNKEMVQHLVSLSSPRVLLTEKDSGGSHYISDVWSRFQVVYVDGVLRSFAACKNCHKVVTYTKYSGTGGLLRHRCASEPKIREPVHVAQSSPIESVLRESRNNLFSFSDGGDFGISSRSSDDHFDSPTALSNPYSAVCPPTPTSQNDSSTDKSEVTSGSQATAMANIARALLQYMCQDLVSASTLDSPAFQQLVWTVLNLGATHGKFREEENLPSSKDLLHSFLQPMVADSRETISRNLQEQIYLSLSLHRREVEDGSVLAVSVHCVNQDFQLQSHALGTRHLRKGDSRDEVVQSLLRDFFHEMMPPSTLREKYVTVVSDDGDPGILGSVGVKCVWHSVEAVLENLTEVASYSRICDEIRSALAFLADSGMERMTSQELRTSEVHRWEPLLHALSFIISHYNELAILINETPSKNSSLPRNLSEKEIYEEVKELLIGIRRCLMTVRDPKRPTLNQAVLCRAKLLHLCSSSSVAMVTQQVKEYLAKKFENALGLAPLHLVASFLDPRCKSLKVFSEVEKGEVHRLVLEMMKAVSVTEANSGVLNLKTTRRSSSPGPAYSKESLTNSAHETHPFSEYMDNSCADLSVSDSEEIMAYVNMKVHLENDDILGWWAGSSSSGLPTLRRLARKILAVPATCAFACQMNSHAVAVSEKMGISDHSHLNNVIHMKFNMS